MYRLSVEIDVDDYGRYFAVLFDESDRVVRVTDCHRTQEDAYREAEEFVTKLENPMIVSLTIHDPHRHNPTGEPYVVRINTGAGTIEVPAWTQAEAGDIRDTALDAGYSARIVGLPTRLAASGFGADVTNLPELED